MRLFNKPRPRQRWDMINRGDPISSSTEGESTAELVFDLIIVGFISRISEFFLEGFEDVRASGADFRALLVARQTVTDTASSLMGKRILLIEKNENELRMLSSPSAAAPVLSAIDEGGDQANGNGDHISASSIVFFTLSLFVVMNIFIETHLQLISQIKVKGDIIHKILHVSELILLGLCAANVDTMHSLSSYIESNSTWVNVDVEYDKNGSSNEALIITICLIFHRLLAMLRYYEFVLCYDAEKDKDVVTPAYYAIFSQLVQLVFIGCSLFAILLKASLEIVCSLWILAFVSVRFVWFAFSFLPKENRFPINVQYTIDRHGVFTMLFLGEGYLCLAFLQLVHYSSMPSTPERHPYRISIYRAVIWTVLNVVLNLSLLFIGLGLKSLLPLASTSIDPKSIYLVCYSFGLYFVTHCAIEETFGGSDHTIDRVARLFKFSLAMIFISIPSAFIAVSETNPKANSGADAIKAYNFHQVWKLSLFSLLLTFFLLAIQMASGAFKKEVIKVTHAQKRIANALFVLFAVIKFRRRLIKARHLKSGEKLKIEPCKPERIKTLDSNDDVCKIEVAQNSTFLRQASYKVRKIDTIIRKIVSGSFYAVPEYFVSWDDLDAKFEGDWAPLFFDLTFAGALSRIAELFIITVTSPDLLISHLISLWSLLMVIINIWEMKAFWLARFASTDVFHKIVDVFEGVLITIAMIFIGENLFLGPGDVTLSNKEAIAWRTEMYGLASCLFVYILIHLFQWVEVRELSIKHKYEIALQEFENEFKKVKREQEHPSQLPYELPSWYKSQSEKKLTELEKIKDSLFGQLMTVTQSIQNLLVHLVFVSISFLMISKNEPFMNVCLCWLTGFLILRARFLFLAAFKYHSNKNTAPIKLEFWLHRLMELSMLFISEGILDIVISYDERNMGLFMLSLLLLFCINQTLLDTDTHEPKMHAARHSRIYGIIVNTMRHMGTLLPLIGIAISLKEIMLGGPDGQKIEIIKAFHYSSGALLFFFYMIYLMHRSSMIKEVKILSLEPYPSTLLQLMCIVIFVGILPSLPTTNPHIHVIGSLLVWIFAMCSQKYFDDHYSKHEEEHEEEEEEKKHQKIPHSVDGETADHEEIASLIPGNIRHQEGSSSSYGTWSTTSNS